MKTSFTFKNRVAPQLLYSFVMVLLFSASVFGSVKHTVNVTNYKYTPAELQIAVGDTVEWKNTQGFHNVNGTTTTYPSNPESFGNSLGSGWTYKYVFKTAGKYDYQCDPHTGFNMYGKIEVKEAGGNEDGKYNLTINFTGMNPHVGQTLWLEVVEKGTGKEVARKEQIVTTQFSLVVSGIEMDHSYFVNFYSDHNKNGKYDAPPADHAWMMELNNVTGESTLNFAHNTSFTDIQWKNKLTVHFMSMTPHVGQTLKLAVVDKNTGVELGRTTAIASADFMVDIYGIENGKSYKVDFFADHNKNGKYDAPPADHAWRLELNDVMGDTTLNFQHNTSFTDIMWKNKLMVHFMGMNPHVGQNLQLAVIEKTSGIEVQRVSVTASVDFWVSVYGIENGMSYNVDFFADHNKNGKYDAPPADHAWRLELNDVMGDTTLMFQHNTSFTDINLISTAISELNNSLFKMYPNPATGRVFIESNEFNSTVIKVMIYDISGKLKLSKIHSPEQVLEIDIHELVNGMYFVELSNENKREMLKLIKY